MPVTAQPVGEELCKYNFILVQVILYQVFIYKLPVYTVKNIVGFAWQTDKKYEKQKWMKMYS